MTQRILSRLWWVPVLIIALCFRLYGINWDEGTHLHPDERFMGMVTEKLVIPDQFAQWMDTSTSSFNPHNQGFDSYVYGTFPLLSTKWVSQYRGDDSLAEILQTGRLLSGFWSTGTVLLLMLAARMFGSRRFAAACGLLMACCVFPIQQAHFFVSDSPGAFFSCAGILLCLHTLRTGARWSCILTGLAVAMAMACRINLGLLVPWCALAAAFQLRTQRRGRVLLFWSAAAVLGLLLFRIAQPYAFANGTLLDFSLNPAWQQDMDEVHAISTGSYPVPFTMQWVGRIPYLCAIYNLIAWGMGWPLGLLAVGGWCLLLVQQFRKAPSSPTFLLCLWPLLPLLYHGGIFLNTMRYFLPMYPWLILCGLLALKQWKTGSLSRTLALLVIVLTAFWALAFMNVYRQPHNRIAASEWIYENLPPGSTIVNEHWDDALPVHLSATRNRWHYEYNIIEFPGYDQDTPEKLKALVALLDQADLVVLSSRRLVDSIPRMPERYPMTTRYYRHLEAGTLGWDAAAHFAARPKLPGYEWDSLQAEEAFRVYDHPVVNLYKKSNHWNPVSVQSLLSDGIEFERISHHQSYLEPVSWNRGFLTGQQLRERTAETSYATRFPAHAVGSTHPTMIWCIVLFSIGLLNAPLQRRIFPGLRDHGWLLSRVVALLLITVPAWWCASIGILAFPRAVGICTFLLFAVNAMLFAMHHDDLQRVFLRGWNRFALLELVFWGVFFVFLLLRMRTPELWHPWAGGEKPMDLAFLHATALTDWLPAQNPWLSDAFINYYGFGFVLVSSLIHLTGVPPTLAYNLALPTFAAFSAAGAFSLAALGCAWFRSRTGWSGWWTAGLLGVTLTLFCGNLGQLRFLMHEQGEGSYSRDGYWNASRVIHVPQGEVEPITEFPFFSQLYGDLHAHMMAMPYAMLCLLLSWQLLRRFHPVRVLLSAIPLAFLYPLNAWDFPVQFCIYTAAVLAPALWDRRARVQSRILYWLGGLCVLKLAALPFHLTYLAPQGGIEAWTGPRSSLPDLFLAHGMFLVPIVLCALLLFLRRQDLRKSPLWSRIAPALLLGGALILIVVVELIRLKDDIGRMNTVFKFYYQVWWILAALAAMLLSAARPSSSRNDRELALYLGMLLFPLAGLVYPLTAPGARMMDRYWNHDGLQLDGTAFMQSGELDHKGERIPLNADMQGMEFLRTESLPSDVILEASSDEYSWGSRFSIHTGNPTVLGWNWHMRQQRPTPYDGTVDWRRYDVDRMYTSTDHTLRAKLLQRYRVRFVVVGHIERIHYDTDLLGLFEDDPNLKEVYESEGLRIYEVQGATPPR